jgi:hypothetical protein
MWFVGSNPARVSQRPAVTSSDAGAAVRLACRHAVLTYADLAAALGSLRRESARRLIVDFSNVVHFEQCSAVFALLIAVGRTLPGGCEVVGARPELRAIAAVILHDVPRALVRLAGEERLAA